MQKNSKNLEKEFYTVKTEVLIPAELEYKILATSPEEAMEIVLKRQHSLYSPPKFHFSNLKFKFIKVFKFKDMFLQLSKRF